MEAILTYKDEFWLKCEDACRSVKRVLHVPSLRKITDDTEELLLCPVRALSIYCKRVHDINKDKKSLFVAHSRPKKAISLDPDGIEDSIAKRGELFDLL